MVAQFQWFQEAGGLTIAVPPRGQIVRAISALTYKSANNADDDISRNPANPNSFITNPIPVGENSFVTYVFGRFSGSWTTLNNLKWAHSFGLIPPVFKLLGRVTSTYTLPTRRAFLVVPSVDTEDTTLDRLIGASSFSNLTPEETQTLLDLGFNINALIQSGLFPEDLSVTIPQFKTDASDYDHTLIRNVEYGAPVNLAVESPADPEISNLLEFSQTNNGICFTQYLATQLFSASSAPPGVLGPITFILRYDET